MKRSQLALLLLPFTCIFLYQNCSQQNFDRGPSAVSSKATTDGSFVPVVLANENIQKIKFVTEEPVFVNQNGNTFTVIKDYEYQVSLSDKKIIKFNEARQPIATYCMTNALSGQLNQIIQTAELCKFMPEAPEDQVCSQAIVPAYATIETNRDHFQLGASRDSCGTDKIDICHTEQNVLKVWIKQVLTGLANLPCPSVE